LTSIVSLVASANETHKAQGVKVCMGWWGIQDFRVGGLRYRSPEELEIFKLGYKENGISSILRPREPMMSQFNLL